MQLIFYYLKLEDLLRLKITGSHKEKIRDKRSKMHRGMFHHNIRKKVFTMETTMAFSNHPSDMVESPSLEVLKIQLDRVLENTV